MAQEEKVAISRCWWVRIASCGHEGSDQDSEDGGPWWSDCLQHHLLLGVCLLLQREVSESTSNRRCPKLTKYMHVCLCIYVSYSHICNNKHKKPLYIEYQWRIVNYYHYIVCSYSKAFSKKMITIGCQKKVHKNISKNFIQISSTWTESQRCKYS